MPIVAKGLIPAASFFAGCSPSESRNGIIFFHLVCCLRARWLAPPHPVLPFCNAFFGRGWRLYDCKADPQNKNVETRCACGAVSPAQLARRGPSAAPAWRLHPSTHVHIDVRCMHDHEPGLIAAVASIAALAQPRARWPACGRPEARRIPFAHCRAQAAPVRRMELQPRHVMRVLARSISHFWPQPCQGSRTLGAHVLSQWSLLKCWPRPARRCWFSRCSFCCTTAPFRAAPRCPARTLLFSHLFLQRLRGVLFWRCLCQRPAQSQWLRRCVPGHLAG